MRLTTATTAAATAVAPRRPGTFRAYAVLLAVSLSTLTLGLRLATARPSEASSPTTGERYTADQVRVLSEGVCRAVAPPEAAFTVSDPKHYDAGLWHGWEVNCTMESEPGAATPHIHVGWDGVTGCLMDIGTGGLYSKSRDTARPLHNKQSAIATAQMAAASLNPDTRPSDWHPVKEKRRYEDDPGASTWLIKLKGPGASAVLTFGREDGGLRFAHFEPKKPVQVARR